MILPYLRVEVLGIVGKVFKYPIKFPLKQHRASLRGLDPFSFTLEIRNTPTAFLLLGIAIRTLGW
jgi:hypothetical protein